MMALVVGMASIAANSTWQVEPLPDDAPVYQMGGLTTYRPLSDRQASVIFVACSDREPWAHIQIDGHIFRLIATSSKTSGEDKNGDGVGMTYDDSYEDVANGLSVETIVTVKSFSAESDSDWEEGTLQVDFEGKTTTILIGGGFAN